MVFLLETNVLSEVRQPQPDAQVLAWLYQVDEDRFYLDLISVVGIARGFAFRETGS